jgi:hypothetical protein
MRRSFRTTFLAAAAVLVAACADTPEEPVAPAEIVRPDLSLLSAASMRAQIDELLAGTARTAAHLQLSRVEQDIRYRRPWLYVDALALAAIPLHERERGRIPPEKLEKLFQFLCSISHLIKPYLPVWLQAIDFCLINPGHLADDAKVQVVSNLAGGTVTTERQTFSLDIEPGSMFNEAGMSVPFVVVVVLPLNRQPPEGDGDPHPCPEPWDGEFPQDDVDCYEEFYDVSVIPRVRFNPAADLEICQLDPSSENENAPSSTVLTRLELFTKDAENVVRILGSDGETDAEAVCHEGNIEHAIGPIDWSREGMRNALATLERFGSRALRLFNATPLYADNFPTHGDIFGELQFGNVVGAIDRGAPAVVSLIDCPVSDPGDEITRGFYVPNYPGITLNQVDLRFSSSVAGTYTFSLTARRDAYNGPLVGISTATATLPADENTAVSTSFFFPSSRVPPGSTLTFAISNTAGPATPRVLYDVGTGGLNNPDSPFPPNCEVIETEGTSPPLDDFRRNGVGVDIFGARPSSPPIP